MKEHNPAIALMLLVIIFVLSATLFPEQGQTTIITPPKDSPIHFGPGNSADSRKAPWVERECHDYIHCRNSVLPFGEPTMYWFPSDEVDNPEYNVCALHVDAPQKVVLDYYQEKRTVQTVYWYGSSITACKQLFGEVLPLDQLPE
jgi:hypothetical protein